MNQQPDWRIIADELADALGNFNHSWRGETRGSMYRYCHEAMVAYYEAAGVDWKAGRTPPEVCKCHP